MRQQFEQHCRHGRNTRFEIGAIPHPAARPFRVESAADVIRNLRHYQVGKVARTVAADIAVKFALVELGVEYAERAYRIVVVGYACVGMECERHVNRYSEPVSLGKTFRTAHKRIHPLSARHIVVLVVVGIVLRAVNAVVETRPLHPVSCAFAIPRHAARRRRIFDAVDSQRIADRAGDIAVSAADFDGVGTDESAFACGAVGKRNDGYVAAFGEFECSQIYPCAAADALVYPESALSAGMTYRIERVIGTFGQAAV